MTRQFRTTVSFWIMASLLILTGVSAWFAQRQHHRVADALREAALYRDVLAQSQTAVIVLDRNGIIQRWSGGASKLFGWSESQAVGYGIAFLVPAEMRERHKVGFGAMMEERGIGQIREIECQARTKGGQLVDIIVHVAAFERNGEVYSFATINRRLNVKRHEPQI